MRILLPLESIRTGMVTADHVFVSGMEGMPLVPRETELTEHMLEALRRHRVSLVPILTDEAPEQEQPLPEVQPMLDERLRDEAVSGIRRMFDIVGSGDAEENLTTAYQVVKEIDDVVDQLVDTLTQEGHALVHITDLKSHDEYTYHHSLSVAVLSIAIGRSMGFSHERLQEMGRCAMMHDIGKTLVPTEIINKPSRLSDEEFARMKGHSGNGFDYLAKAGIGDEAFRQGVLGHHEKYDGTGYPHGLKGNEIPLFARIIAVADVYDAVTSYRSYRSPMSPAEAIELIMSQAGTAFDYAIVKAFLQKLQLYPVHTCVELSNGRRGIVVENTNAMRPVLQMLDNNEILDLTSLSTLSLLITRVLDGHTAASQ